MAHEHFKGCHGAPLPVRISVGVVERDRFTHDRKLTLTLVRRVDDLRLAFGDFHDLPIWNVGLGSALSLCVRARGLITLDWRVAGCKVMEAF